MQRSGLSAGLSAGLSSRWGARFGAPLSAGLAPAPLAICALTCAALSACLPLSDAPPECFPEEGCPINLTCEAGRCVAPPERDLTVRAACVVSDACVESARLASPESAPALTAEGALTACLILEQPQLLSAHPIYLATDGEGGVTLLSPEVSVRAPLFDAPLRASLALLTPGASCPDGAEEIRARGLDALCLEERGCRLRLRRPELSREELRAEGPLSLSFDQEGGQCFERAWSEGAAPAPSERCDGGDNDCDGFIDEGLACPSLVR